MQFAVRLLRHEGQCTYVSAAGQRCESRTLLEFHHRVSVADGGPPTVENIRLLCGAHHDAESSRVFDWRRMPDASHVGEAAALGARSLPFAPSETERATPPTRFETSWRERSERLPGQP
jgi:hypothetical protein